MDVLRNLFGNLSSGIIRLLVTVGILGATYLFIIKPILDTTDNAINRSFNSFGPNSAFQKNLHNSLNQSFGNTGSSGNNIQRQVQKAIRDVNRQVNKQIRHSGTGTVQTQKLLNCLKGASGNVQKVQACTKKFT
jgi:hypothetical protein